MKSGILAALAALSFTVSGCVVQNEAAYDSCKTTSDCSGPYAESCVLITQDWGAGVVATDSICTSQLCDQDEECSVSANGNLGYCSVLGILGAGPGTCFERCYYDRDCSPGFVCAAGTSDVPGVPETELICVPEGSGTVTTKDSYATCSESNQCGGLNSCETLSPKWNTTTDVFELSVCTVVCAADKDCPLSTDGEEGFCAAMNDISGPAVCVERCNVPGDCRPGFLCAPMSDVVGLPDAPTDRICLPDPKFAL